jgi:protease I
MKRLCFLVLAALLTLTACGPKTPSPTVPPPPDTPTSPTEAPTSTPPISPLPTESPLAVPGLPPRGGGTGTILLIVAPEDFRDEEYFEPRDVFEAAGYTVVVASLTLDAASGMLGGQVVPDLLLADVDVAAYDAVVFVGGPGSAVYFDDPQAHRLAQSAVEQDKVLAAICIAPIALARAGVLEGKLATLSRPDDQCVELEAGGATCTSGPIERDGRIVTATGPEVSTEFAEVVVQALQEP